MAARLPLLLLRSTVRLLAPQGNTVHGAFQSDLDLTFYDFAIFDDEFQVFARIQQNLQILYRVAGNDQQIGVRPRRYYSQ